MLSFFSFKDTADRKEFVLTWGICWALGILSWRVIEYLALKFAPELIMAGYARPLQVIIWTVFQLLPIWVTVRRLHDINASGWWAFIFYHSFAWVIVVLLNVAVSAEIFNIMTKGSDIIAFSFLVFLALWPPHPKPERR